MALEADGARTDALYHEMLSTNYRRVSRMFVPLLLAQWAFAVVIALVISPTAWEGKASAIHYHVWIAVIGGAIINSLPLFLLQKAPSETATRMIVAVAQMMWSALLIHLTGGRIETHFHVFGSLAFLAFYRDWKVIVPATVTVAADHLARGMLWPESVYGIANPEWWRFLEHAGWVVFEDIVLVFGCMRGVEELLLIAQQQARAEALSESERKKAVALAEANEELMRSRDAMKKLAEVGELAASVGHELRNPLAAVRNGLAYLSKRVLDPAIAGPQLAADPRVKSFLELMDKELQTSSRTVADLLDFARERPPQLRQCPLFPLVDEALALVPARANVKLLNEVPKDLPVPELDRDQFRQALINLIQNAAESIPSERQGTVVVRSVGGGRDPWRITITDDGVGIPKEIQGRIFQPLFTTKTKGTGLGLAIVAGMVQRHGGTIAVESTVGKGSTFSIELPARQPAALAAV